MSKKIKNQVGYRLHKHRIIFSGSEIIRTIKYPLISENFNEIENFKKSVINDDLTIRGDINLNDYLKYSYNGKKIYTLFDFWIDSLKAGVIWADKGTTLSLYRDIFFPNSKLIKDTIWENASEEIKNFFDKDKFIDEFISKSQVKSNSTIDSFKKRLNKCLKKGVKKENQVLNFIDYLTTLFFDDSGKLKLNTSEQDKVWKNLGLNKDIISESKPQGYFKNITFLIIPELINFEANSIETLINIRKYWLAKYFKNDTEINDWLKKILDLIGNFNSFSNYFNNIINSLKDEKTKEIAEALFFYLPSKNEYNEKVLNSLKFLSEKAKLLSNHSNLVNSWADYRMFFAGKIQSWFSNFIKRQNELDKKISEFKSNLIKSNEYLDSLNIKEARNELIEIKNLIQKLIHIKNEDIKKEKEFEIFDILLSSLRKRLNFFYQQYLYDEKKENDNVRNDKILGKIFENIEKPIAFYGESQKKKNKKFVEKTIPILEEGILFLRDLIQDLKNYFLPEKTFDKNQRKNETDEKLFRRELEFVFNKLKDLALNSKEFSDEYKKILSYVIKDVSIQEILNKKNKGKYTFYKSEYSKGNVEQLELKATEKNYLLRFKGLINYLVLFLLKFEQKTLLQNKKILLDWVELAKNITSNLIRFNEQEEFSIDKIKSLNYFEKAKNYIDLFRLDKTTKNEFSFIIQSLIFSEVKGSATLFSKEKYTASYSIQIMRSNEKYRIFYQPLDQHIDIFSEDKKSLMRKHRYFLAYKKLKKADNSQENKINLLILDKNKIEKFTSYGDEIQNKTFILSSSVYQLQFLDKYLYRPKGWENIDISLGEWSFLVEEEYIIKWDLDKKIPLFEKDIKNKKNKLYVAIPFNLKANIKDSLLNKIVPKSENNNDYKRDKIRLNYPILGVDVGEYGLAWYLAKFIYDDNFNIKDIEIFGKGFIEDNNIGKIKDYFAEIQQKSRLGAYDEDDTTIVKIRKNAIGKLRNAIHSVLLIKFNNGGSLVYEDAITNFETGSGKTTKIYNSVKRGDTEFKSQADQSEHELIWGKKTRYIGRNISAYASSYFCVNCLKSIYQIKKDDLSNIKVEKRDGNILKLSFNQNLIYAYSKDKKKFYEGKIFSNTKENFNDLMKALKDFARPPLKDSEVIKKFVLNKNILTKKKLKNIRKKRGNSAIFVCPYCQFVADADIQAAFMMAMRGYLRFSGIVPPKTHDLDNSEKTGDTFIKKTFEYLNKLDKQILKKITDSIKI